MMHAGKTLEDSIVHDVLEFFRLPWGQVSGCAKDLMRQMLRKDPNQRPLAQQLLQHPWFTLEDPGLDQPFVFSCTSCLWWAPICALMSCSHVYCMLYYLLSTPCCPARHSLSPVSLQQVTPKCLSMVHLLPTWAVFLRCNQMSCNRL